MHKHLIAIVAGAVCLFVGLFCGGVSGFFFGRVSSANSMAQPKDVQKQTPVPPPAPAPVVDKSMAQPKDVQQQITREEFRAAVVGKNADDVINAVGRPDTTQDFGRGPVWYYRNRTRDQVSDKLDAQLR